MQSPHFSIITGMWFKAYWISSYIWHLTSQLLFQFYYSSGLNVFLPSQKDPCILSIMEKKKKKRTQTLVRRSWWNIILELLSMRASDDGNHRRRWYRLGSSFNQQVGLGLNLPERHRVTQQASSQRTDGFSLPTMSTAPTQLSPRLLSSLSANP